jgi:hypothetical protein
VTLAHVVGTLRLALKSVSSYRGCNCQVREQLQLLDPPLLLEQAPGVGGCGASVVGLGPRVYLLTSGGLSWGRLMQWSERLKTLQVRTEGDGARGQHEQGGGVC